ncbi:hypothetical protein DFJ73DRAFT_663318 [Zopfochytrium polystomum]|nr:hypothetical protein DFJ73DRAFT_663318 [Zopfochytrium polystomum]
MRERGSHDIMPVLLSSRQEATLKNGNKTIASVDFSTFDYTKFPTKPHAHPLSPGLQTVSETVKMILELNGPKANPETDVMKVVTEAKEMYNRRKAELKSPRPSKDISLSRSSLAVLEKWLTPLSDLMDVEREALLKNVLSGSRQWLLKKVFKFLSPDDPTAASANRVMWLKGVAGMGKSVMAAMVSRELQAQGMLGGLFFCKHDDECCSSARNLVLTLVFGLAKLSLQYGEILIQVKQDNPDILSRSVFEMMKVLLVQPLEKVVKAKKVILPVVLVVDALDDCGAINKRNEFRQCFSSLIGCFLAT